MFKYVEFRVLACRFQARRCYAKKVLKDLTYVEELPVHDLPKKSSKETSVFGWGTGEHGGLGHYVQKKKKMSDRGDLRFRNFRRPFRMLFGEKHKVNDIAAGFGFSVFSVNRNDQYKVFGTGLNTDGQIGYQEVRRDRPMGIILSPVPITLQFKHPEKTKVIALSAGRAHLAIVTDLEGVFTLGNNSYGQCGRTIVEDEDYAKGRSVHRIPKVDGEKVKSVECGQDHTLFLTENGKVFSCGWGADGQTGLGNYDNEPHPKQVLGDIEGETIVKLSSKSDCVLALNDKGEVFGWGNSEYSQIFDSTQPYQQINKPIHMKKCTGFGKIVDVACGGSHCLIVNEAGDVFSWGYGILGRGPNVQHSWTPEIIPPILFGRNDFLPESKVTNVYCSLYFSAATTNYGHIYTWGKNKNFCLGLSTKTDQFFPFRVYINALAKKLALGVDHSVALCQPF